MRAAVAALALVGALAACDAPPRKPTPPTPPTTERATTPATELQISVEPTVRGFCDAVDTLITVIESEGIAGAVDQFEVITEAASALTATELSPGELDVVNGCAGRLAEVAANGG